jgi:hypothetical protein
MQSELRASPDKQQQLLPRSQRIADTARTILFTSLSG